MPDTLMDEIRAARVSLNRGLAGVLLMLASPHALAQKIPLSVVAGALSPVLVLVVALALSAPRLGKAGLHVKMLVLWIAAFLLSVPAILAAAAKATLDLEASGWAGVDGRLFAVGMVTSAVVGYVTVKYFIRFLATHRLDVFAWYRVVLALGTFIWLWGQ